MPKDFSKYNIDLEIKFKPLEKIDLKRIVAETKEKWSNRTPAKVNDSVVRLGVLEGEFHWHKHDTDDEFFFVTEGKLIIELKDRVLELNPGQGVTIPRGVMHFPKAPKRTVVLMVETRNIVPTGD
jgi:mannose-6-phosphate isomerase-like protein (cupin superfamily)